MIIFCMKTISSMLLIILLSFSYSAYALEYKVTLNSKLLYVENKQVKARIFQISPNVRFFEPFSNKLSANLDVSFPMEIGSNNSSLGISEYQPNQRVFLNHGVLNFKPISFINLSVGAINQDWLKSPLLISDTAFAGFKTTINLENRFYFHLQQLIPNNDQLEAKLNSSSQGTPLFFSETIGFENQSSKLFTRLELTHFSFHKLSSDIANSSALLGNSVNGLATLSEFTYKFQGWNLYSLLEHQLKKGHSLRLKGHFIHNNKASNKRSQAFLYQLAFKFRSQLYAGIEFFKSESDSSVAFYNDKRYGHNNFKGHGLIFGQESDKDSKSKLTYEFRILKRNIISNSIYQSDSVDSTFNVSYPVKI